MSYDYDEYGNPLNSFEISDVDLTADEEVPSAKKEYRNVPAGTYNMQVQDALPKAYYDNADEAKTHAKRLIPLEVIDEGEHQGDRYLMTIYMPPPDDGDNMKMYKYKQSKKRMAMLAKACGRQTVSDLNDCAGQFVVVTLAEEGKKNFLEVQDVKPFSVKSLQTPPQAPVEQPKTETVVKDDIPF